MPWSQQLLRLPRGVRGSWGHFRWPGTGSIIEPWSCWCLGGLTASDGGLGWIGSLGVWVVLGPWTVKQLGRYSKLDGWFKVQINDLFKNDLINATSCLGAFLLPDTRCWLQDSEVPSECHQVCLTIVTRKLQFDHHSFPSVWRTVP